MRKALSDKIMVLGIDGMDPRLTRTYVDRGLMPNVAELIKRGSARKDLVLLGGHPTVTPPMWTTLSTGTYACTHGITGFGRIKTGAIDCIVYNLDSKNLKVEQLWDVFANAGKKTLVWHWPGCSWPPTQNSPDLAVVDGTQPAMVNMGVAQVENEFICVASEQVEELIYKEKASTDSNIPCVITDLKTSSDRSIAEWGESLATPENRHLILSIKDGEHGISDAPFDVVLSPIKPAAGWAQDIQGAKEFAIYLSGGLIRRVGLVLPNEAGIYDKVELYTSKKEQTPVAVLNKGVYTQYIYDKALKNDEMIDVYRAMRLLDLKEDGSYLKLWISCAYTKDNDQVWHPKSLYQEIVDNVGRPPVNAILGGGDEVLIRDCMMASWDIAAQWQSKAINYLIENDGYEIVFSHFHNIDAEGHMLVRNLKGNDKLSKESYAKLMEDMYIQTDNYIGEFLHLLDKGWTLLLVSDHAQVCPEHEVNLLGDGSGVNIRVMQELGYTVLKLDENGNELPEIDWTKTKAVAVRANDIYINLKGRTPEGIVDPEDQYELEEEIMTALYGYRDKKTGRRIVSVALRNKDGILLGYGGPECGDIVYWIAEGYNYDHVDSLSTTYGVGGTSVSPIFIAAGPGIKAGYETNRIIRQVDVAPTMAVLGGVRMPRDCEGAPVYQILTEEY